MIWTIWERVKSATIAQSFGAIRIGSRQTLPVGKVDLRRITSMKHKADPSEKQIEQACTELLELDGWRSLRTDPVSRREWGKGFGEKGMPDHLYLRYKKLQSVHAPEAADVLWIEWKSRGGKSQPHQQTWHQAERARGALVWVAGEDWSPSTIESFVAHYNSSGLALRNMRIKAVELHT